VYITHYQLGNCFDKISYNLSNYIILCHQIFFCFMVSCVCNSTSIHHCAITIAHYLFREIFPHVPNYAFTICCFLKASASSAVLILYLFFQLIKSVFLVFNCSFNVSITCLIYNACMISHCMVQLCPMCNVQRTESKLMNK
jgi:hypothetical protein